MFICGLEDNVFRNPAEMSDLELEREYKALLSTSGEVMSDERISSFWKWQIIEHAKVVVDEYQRRSGEAIIAPFDSFGFI